MSDYADQTVAVLAAQGALPSTRQGYLSWAHVVLS